MLLPPTFDNPPRRNPPRRAAATITLAAMMLTISMAAAADPPAADPVAADQPAVDQPAADQPAVDPPAADQPAVVAGTAAPPGLDAAQATALVQRLGADTFAEREAAATEIFAAGAQLLPALRAAAERDADPEVRLRAGLVYQQIASTDFETRAAAFIADGADAHTFPGWRYAAAQLGSSKTMRGLFIKISRDHPAFVAALEGTPRERAEQVQPLIKPIQQSLVRLRDLDISDTFAVLLVAADPNVPLTSALETTLLSLLIKASANQVRQDAQLAEPFDALVGRWMRRARMDHVEQILYLAMQWDLQDAVTLAVRTVVETRDPTKLTTAMQAIARFGDRGHVPHVQHLLDDQRPAGDGVPIAGKDAVVQVQIGDVAMATIATLHGVSLESVGFASAMIHPKMGFDIDSLRFPTAAARSNARAVIDALLQR